MWCVIRGCQVQIGVWLTQINSIIKIFCAICGICERAWWVISLVYSCHDFSAMFAKRVKKSKTGIVYEC